MEGDVYYKPYNPRPPAPPNPRPSKPYQSAAVASPLRDFAMPGKTTSSGGGMRDAFDDNRLYYTSQG